MNGMLTFRTSRTLAPIVVLAAVFTACGAEPENTSDSAASEGVAPADATAGAIDTDGTSGYQTIDVLNGGTIRGTVRFTGTVPPSQTVTIGDDAEVCGESRETQLIETGAGGGLMNAVISLVDITQGAGLVTPARAPELDQNGCRFSPHVQLVQTGSPVAILNSDPVMHNVHTFTFDNRPVNRSQPPGVERIEIEFSVPEKVRVRCDVHDWMSAWIVSIEHPYHAVTGADGSFEIANVPPGTYTLEAWHESLGTSERTVTVGADGAVEADISMTGQG